MSEPVRVRQQVTVSRETGEFTVEATVLPGGAGFGQRWDELKASLPDLGEIEERFAALACDGCGARADIDFDVPVYPEGWRELPDGDFCPACAAARGAR